MSMLKVADSEESICRGIDTIQDICDIPDKSYDVVLTDPPYDFDLDTKFYLHQEFLRIARSAIIVFAPPENQWDFGADHYLFWIKPISTKNTSKNYSRFVEMIFVYKLENYIWNPQYHWSNYVNVFEDRVLGLSDHPHEKPESLIKRLILLHSNQGDTVFDPFCGSGTIPRVANDLLRHGGGWDIK